MGAALDAYHYSYPPVLLLLITPLALMAHVPALLAWLAAGWYAFYRALRLAMPGQGALLLALAAPGGFHQRGRRTEQHLDGGAVRRHANDPDCVKTLKFNLRVEILPWFR